MKYGSAWAIVVGLALGGCGAEPPGATPPPSSPPPQPALLSRSDREPAGANCTYGGTALRAGLDRNADGILEDNEVEHTDYVCDVSTTVLVRKDPFAPLLECPAGGVAVQTGIDDNRDGILQDAEIDQTTRVCNSLDLWDG